MLIRTVAGNKCVTGLTVLDGELYVVRSQAADIEVYQVGQSAFQPVRLLTVQRLRQPTDIAASQTASVVYVADAVGYIIVVDQSGNVCSRFQVITKSTAENKNTLYRPSHHASKVTRHTCPIQIQLFDEDHSRALQACILGAPKVENVDDDLHPLSFGHGERDA